jgi:hypothetical protein
MTLELEAAVFGVARVQVRFPAHAEHGFRLKLNADSGGS